MSDIRRTPRDLKRKAMAAPYEDGVLELLMALLFVGIAALWVAGRGELLGLLALPIIIGGGFLLTRIKRTVTEPRIGHVQPRSDDNSPAWHWLAFFCGGLLLMTGAILLTGDLGTSESWVRWMPLFSGYLIAGAFRYLATASGLRRYLILGAISLIVGAGVSIASDGSSYAPLAVYFLIMAGVTTAFGATALVVFMSRHPRLATPAAGPEGGTTR